MAIVTISRGTHSGGESLACCLAASLDYRVLSTELLHEAAEQYGVKPENLQKGLETAPSFLDRFRIDRQIYLAVLRATLCRVAREDNLVFHGHAGHFLLQGIEQVLRVRVIAPMAQRVRAAVKAGGLDEKDAEAWIQARDAGRVSWTRFLYGVEWNDSSLYDLVVNLEKVSIEAACNMIVTLLSRADYQMTEEGLRRIDDLYLASHVKAKLFLNPKIAAAAAKTQVEARSGEVFLSGVLPGESFLEDVLETVRALPEVREVHADWLGSYTPPA